MEEIAFKVSARAARLIGRENIASSKGAIIELVKNAYDADSKSCIVYFDNLHLSLQPEIFEEDSSQIIKIIGDDNFNNLYAFNSKTGSFTLNKDIDKNVRKDALLNLSKNTKLYIIDFGEGMTDTIIKDNWMVIGTDGKLNDVFTKDGRVKAGAKGIGRFALDKLGSRCTMFTYFDPERHTISDENLVGFKWKVNWNDFEGKFKTIEKVTASLEGLAEYNLDEICGINGIVDNYLQDILKTRDEVGTVLIIEDLRDIWEDLFVEQVFVDLEVLVPPKELNEFDIYLYSSMRKNEYGLVSGSLCDDFDYKMTATCNTDKSVEIRIDRHEYEYESIDPRLWMRKKMQIKPRRKQDFKKGHFVVKTNLSSLISGFESIDEYGLLDEIGKFSFVLYYMKKGYSSNDLNRFFYKQFNSSERRRWLDEFGGIKLFRDNFRVRPYGETKDSAFDWLGLGLRKSQNQAGIAKSDGGWKVEPENIAGSIFISRLANVNFEDKSSREGLQENNVFSIFKQIIISLVSILEKDRAFLAREMDALYQEVNFESINKKSAESLASKIISKNDKSSDEKNSKSSESENEEADPQALYVLAKLNEGKDEEIEKLKDEQKLLRGLASSGIVMASFSHDLSKLNDVLGSRIDLVKSAVESIIDAEKLNSVSNRNNPIILLERMRKQDVKLKNWLQYSLGNARKDKRTRKKLVLWKYFKSFEEDWKPVFSRRAVKFSYKVDESINVRAFEIDFDGVFQNLVVNSIDAFSILKEDRQREIIIAVKRNKRLLTIDYKDTGPGLDPTVEDPSLLFNSFETTKRNPLTGEINGTGLGLWIVKRIMSDYEGQCVLLHPDIGFGIRLTFPVKYISNK